MTKMFRRLKVLQVRGSDDVIIWNLVTNQLT